MLLARFFANMLQLAVLFSNLAVFGPLTALKVSASRFRAGAGRVFHDAGQAFHRAGGNTVPAARAIAGVAGCFHRAAVSAMVDGWISPAQVDSFTLRLGLQRLTVRL